MGIDVPCQFNVGLGYLKGRFGHTKNAHCAKIYMMAAAAQGDAKAIEDMKLLNACASCCAPDAGRTCQGCRSATGNSTARYCTPACQAAALEGPRAGLRSLPVPPLQVEPAAPRVNGVHARAASQTTVQTRTGSTPRPHREECTHGTGAGRHTRDAAARKAHTPRSPGLRAPFYERRVSGESGE